MDLAFNLLIGFTIVVAAAAIGLRTSLDVIRTVGHRDSVAILLTAVVLNLVIVPLAALVVVDVLPITDGARTGILLCAICAGGPLSLKTGQIARGSLTWALGLTVILLMANIVALPVWTGIFFDQTITAEPLQLFSSLALLVVLPVLAGAFARGIDASRADLAAARFDTASSGLLVVAVIFGLVIAARELGPAFASWTPVAIVAVLGISAATAFLVPGPVDVRHVAVLVTVNRATSVALLVVGRWYADEPDVLAAVVAFGILQTAVALTAAVAMRRRSGATAPIVG